VLVGYVVSDEDPGTIRSALAQRLPDGLVPMIVPLPELPRGRSGKVDRKALPWPPPQAPAAGDSKLSGTAAWVAERWIEQLGPIPITADSDFFELGGSSLAAAKLVSVLRERYPAVAVADVYEHRQLQALVSRLERLGVAEEVRAAYQPPHHRGWAAAQLVGVVLLQLVASAQFLLGVLTINRLTGSQYGPEIGWGWLIAGWVLFASTPGRALMLLSARRLLMRRLSPGRYPRHSWLAYKVWLVERLAANWALDGFEGTPWAPTYARLCGHRVGRNARLGTLPPLASLLTIGDDVTIEGEVDLEGMWYDGDELVVGEVRIGDRARVATMSVLMPGAGVGEDAELEPGTVITGVVPPGERWEGSPGRRVGKAGEHWPSEPAPAPTAERRWRLMFAGGMAIKNLLPLIAFLPGVWAVVELAPKGSGAEGLMLQAIMIAPLLVAAFILSYGLIIALLVRAVSPLLKPGLHPDYGSVGWGLWFTGILMAGANGMLFSLYASIYTRAWLRLLGIKVGKRSEISITSGLNRLTSFGEATFATDAVVFACARGRLGWLHVGPIEIGDRTFLGNGSIVLDSSTIGDDCLVGVLSRAPRVAKSGTSWLGCPPFELPRRAEATDPTRTLNPPLRLVIARGAADLARILVPGSLALMLASLVFGALDGIGSRDGLLPMVALTPVAFIVAGLAAMVLTVALKWLLMGRYRPGSHPLWSFFVWRDEFMNTCQEQLAGAWLLGAAQATPIMSFYLRLMGAKVGHDVFCETGTITEFDMVELGSGCVLNRAAIVQTHLMHDRLLQIGPTKLGAGATLGPIAASLPDTMIGERCSIGALSVVMRGEQLPPASRWHGVPVVAA
ncbi:MAG: hypothetical protein JOZ73_00060, partial [Solirubrobacterales bacterium]|nr:hypothetical protein [Solirubrobacterales bacterium]